MGWVLYLQHHGLYGIKQFKRALGIGEQVVWLSEVAVEIKKEK